MVAGCQNGNVRNRSKMPLVMSMFSAVPVYIVIITTVCTSTPGRKYRRYSPVEPANAPPNRYVNISRKTTGIRITSSSCAG
jgi:hypothetical protein